MIFCEAGPLFMPQGVTIFIVCASAFVFIAMVFVVSILGSRIVNTRRSSSREKILDEFQKTINVFIILESSDETNIQFPMAFYLDKLQRKIRSSFSKQLLIDLLISSKQNLSGSSSSMLKEVYHSLKLDRFSFSKLRSSSRIRKIQGLQELAEMECKDAFRGIQQLLTHKATIVRQESFIAMIRLVGTPFELAERYKGAITPWMQLTIHKHLSRMESDRLPRFYNWFDNANADVRKFAMSMSHLFRQQEAVEHLGSLLKDRNHEIASLAAAALGDMGAVEYSEAIADLGRRYPSHKALQLKIIRALEQVGNGKQHGSQLAWQMIHGTYDVRIAAMRAMHNLGLDCKDFLIDYNPSNDCDFMNLYAHITEPLLQS